MAVARLGGWGGGGGGGGITFQFIGSSWLPKEQLDFGGSSS